MENKVPGLAQELVEEAIRADITMHEMQMEEWLRIASHPPKGEHIPKDLLVGFGGDQYLALKELKLDLKLKPVPVKGFFNRLKASTKVLFGRHFLREGQTVFFEVCKEGEQGGHSFQIIVRRGPDGEFESSVEDSGKINESK